MDAATNTLSLNMFLRYSGVYIYIALGDADPYLLDVADSSTYILLKDLQMATTQVSLSMFYYS